MPESYSTLNIFIGLSLSSPNLDPKVSKEKGTWLTHSSVSPGGLLPVWDPVMGAGWPQICFPDRSLRYFQIHPLKLDAIPDLHCLLLYKQTPQWIHRVFVLEARVICDYSTRMRIR